MNFHRDARKESDTMIARLMGQQGVDVTKRVVSHQIRKSIYAEELYHDAKEQAKKTETKDDDRFVRYSLPDLLEDEVYNASSGLNEDTEIQF